MSQIKQSFSWWCFDKVGMMPEHLLRAAADIGYQGVELVQPEHWPRIREYGLTIVSSNGGLSIEQGLNRREHHAPDAPLPMITTRRLPRLWAPDFTSQQARQRMAMNPIGHRKPR